MARIQIPDLSAEEVKQFPREFALLTQVAGYETGSVKAEVRRATLFLLPSRVFEIADQYNVGNGRADFHAFLPRQFCNA